MIRAIPPRNKNFTTSQWVIALKEQGHLPETCKTMEYTQVALTPDEYYEVLERASLEGQADR